MGKIREVKPVKLIMGIIARDENIIREAEPYLKKSWGEIDLRSPVAPFNLTDYYEEEMGGNLLRQWWSFSELINAGLIAEIKIKTNEIEEEISADGKRRINLDPGYADGAKLILASTKNYSHRIYLGSGIYAEVTLIYEKGAFHPLDWTYPDYKDETALQFFTEVRARYLEQIK
jgi:hypothetical protein